MPFTLNIDNEISIQAYRTAKHKVQRSTCRLLVRIGR